MTVGSPPDPDDFEISVFGPGVGECVVVHLGGGEWLVVDSCIESSNRRPVALEYLEALNVDVSRAIKLVVVTHWHDDHIRGASDLVRQASEARFACSAVLKAEEFKRFIAASKSLNTKATGASGVDEFAAILSCLQERRRSGVRKEAVGPEWTSANGLLFRRAANTVAPLAEVFALSPSPASVSRGFHELARFLPKRREAKRAAVAIEPNETSVVLSVRVGDVCAILGSDLENGASNTTGWGAVLTTTALPTTPAHVFKVPHHGSENAYHQPAWETALVPNVTAVLTPFVRGRQALPTSSDLERMRRHTDRLYCTAPPPSRATFPDPKVLKVIQRCAKQFRSRRNAMGHIRVRVAANSPQPRVELFGAAFAVTS
jgi:beta-lactamase superfamily II metal-dependent hydrolase